MTERFQHIQIPIVMAAGCVIIGTAMAQVPTELLVHQHRDRAERFEMETKRQTVFGRPIKDRHK